MAIMVTVVTVVIMVIRDTTVTAKNNIVVE
jgi:hypothetical protein